MRRALLLLALFAGPAFADEMAAPPSSAPPSSMDPQAAETVRIKLHRYLFDSVGQRTDIPGLCSGPATQVEVKRTAGDIAFGIFSLGFYVPVHVRVVCAAHTAP
jgi:hypothetical protein